MVDLQPKLIVVEATGGYQLAVVDVLFLAGLSVEVVNPARARQSAKLGAQVLAVFGQRVQCARCGHGDHCHLAGRAA